MKRKIIGGMALISLLVNVCVAQAPRTFKSWVPSTDKTVYALEGQGWKDGMGLYYDRLPQRAENAVRKDVWNLSRNSAGLSLRFRTDADEIVIRYTVKGTWNMPHMPTTGVSGVDLYAKSIDGQWQFCAGNYNFSDTVVYRFTKLKKQDQHVKNVDYTLYLPLYNSVNWLSVSVPEESVFKPVPVRADAPIVVYGTSIAQGGCASRPGMAWTNILERKLDRPVINLGFSGNGRLEKEVVEFLTEIDAGMYVLDCLPNLTGAAFTETELKKRITATVQQLQEKRPGVPVLLTEHDGYTNDATSAESKESYTRVNRILKAVVDSMLTAGVKNISLLTKEEIGQDLESTVDGIHPSDLGMMNYANAYTKKIKSILKEQTGNSVTTIPVTQRRDAGTYDWETRHAEVLAYNKAHKPQVVFMGNSITHFWGGNPVAPVRRGTLSWDKYFEPKGAVNMGFGWDRVENVLWRVAHGELDGISPAYLVLMIGTNNLQLNTDEEIVSGIKNLVQVIQAKQPATQIILMGILPRRNMESRVAGINKLISRIPDNKKIKFLNAGGVFLQADGKIQETLFSDGLHPNQEGYEKLGALINKQLKM
ncbi:SGNH/GDSL hydrolase family protein [Chitinophaga sp.]|uniref:SGNH/GDSL hydrolase family protein n=1 Tax=Chitinophaga sp. TaxID=1869181 RepID=UPI002F93FD29